MPKFNYYPLYICNQQKDCSKSEGCVKNGGPCSHTADHHFAKNQSVVTIYDMFFDTFEPVYDEESDGIIGYIEKES